jgi:two-component system sensor histidine kinase ComP
VLNIILALLLSIGRFTNKEMIQQDKLVEVLENERYKISAYLHDDVLQSLFAIKNISDSEKRNEIVSDMAVKIRNLSNNLYPLIVDNLGLDKSLEHLLKDLQSSHPVAIEYDYKFPQGALSRTMESSIYRITKELVTNAVKHSECQNIIVSTRLENSRFLLQVEDDGKGFELPKEETLLLNKHQGLYTIQQQVAVLHGQIIFHSDHVGGTRYRIEIPIFSQEGRA